MEYRKEIELVIRESTKLGFPFAFTVDKNDGTHLWFSLSYLYRSFKPEANCDYKIEKLEVGNGKINLIEEKEFQQLEKLVDYLVSCKVNPDNRRAMH